MSDTPKTIYLKDYTAPAYLVESIDLEFNLGEQQTEVTSRIRFHKNHDGAQPLVLDGQELTLQWLKLDGIALTADDYRIDGEALTIFHVPEQFVLEVCTVIYPQNNTSLEGLYRSSGNFCTQCEAEGFRKITYYPDRPDVMASFSTTIIADQGRYPVLLSNGNLVESKELAGGRHMARWVDPHKKPCYLFALVAGNLQCIEDTFVTSSGREVALKVYVEAHNIDQCDHAMRSLKRAMKWDEEVYGREYDLDIYMIVAVDDFNMGAMENKGLNVFNSKYVLARPDTATDTDFINIEAVVGHEYFHNWSGNRVTCRDWFQLSLKEGFTVFRDQEFTADMFSRAVKRIDDVNQLRSLQFVEDAGPMAHPVRPASYVEINNFYTLTVYEKGAEVVRMIHTLVGADGFRKGCDLYFERHDGQAVTTEDFVAAMETANGIDLTQFKRWYAQAGTPKLDCSGEYDAAAQQYRLTVRQSCAPSPGQPEKQPYHIPLAVGLLNRAGAEMALTIDGQRYADTTAVLHVTAAEQTFVFDHVSEAPLPSLLRHFSAPVTLTFDYRDEELAFLMANDSDGFNRWDAGQRLAVRVIQALVAQAGSGQAFDLDATGSSGAALIKAYEALLSQDHADANLYAEALRLPKESYLGGFFDVVDPVAIADARWYLMQQIGQRFQAQLAALYQHTPAADVFAVEALDVGRRAVRNTALAYLMAADADQYGERCYQQFAQANNMTDSLSALAALVNSPNALKETALAEFYTRWQREALVVDKWFTLQATARGADTLQRVQALRQHAAFSIKNPNRLRSLVGAFAQGNPAVFHQADGTGYRFLADHVIELNTLNPQIAARLLSPLIQWRRYDASRQALMQAELQRILDTPHLSKDVFEIASKGLAK